LYVFWVFYFIFPFCLFTTDIRLFLWLPNHLSILTNLHRYLVAATTIWSGLSYVFSKDAVKILSKEEIQRRIARAAGKKNP
jgi:hypothetical protein